MQISDPISDFLTRLRNAAQAKHKRVELPSSRQKAAIAKILKEQGYIKDYVIVENKPQDILQVTLRYHEGEPAFREIRRVSKPGIRKYSPVSELPRVRSGLGIAIVSTPKGVITDKEARQLNVGGEIICTVW